MSYNSVLGLAIGAIAFSAGELMNFPVATPGIHDWEVLIKVYAFVVFLKLIVCSGLLSLSLIRRTSPPSPAIGCLMFAVLGLSTFAVILRLSLAMMGDLF
ncbi:hypothetical protein QJS04_geneDACA024945 [Acorus gramineus]|uniref:Uncharacterized protein n=1 Tax=Acorus gramineus TaxID=55184 RepID=A0AAV9A0Y1_ACOGR|nr:hypothetical protein QJS04_geneDACA024945 [Acorus gramineus]